MNEQVTTRSLKTNMWFQSFISQHIFVKINTFEIVFKIEKDEVVILEETIFLSGFSSLKLQTHDIHVDLSLVTSVILLLYFTL